LQARTALVLFSYMNMNTLVLRTTLSVAVAAILFSFSLVSYAADRSSSLRVGRDVMCSTGMFCQTLVFNKVQTSSVRDRAVSVSCNGAFGAPGFNTSNGFLLVGDYYLQSSNVYVAHVGASLIATTSPQGNSCVGPHIVTSTTKPSGMREVQAIGNAFWQKCALNGSEIFVSISAADYAALATAPGIPPLKIDANRPTSCVHSPVIQNNSPPRR